MHLNSKQVDIPELCIQAIRRRLLRIAPDRPLRKNDEAKVPDHQPERRYFLGQHTFLYQHRFQRWPEAWSVSGSMQILDDPLQLTSIPKDDSRCR